MDFYINVISDVAKAKIINNTNKAILTLSNMDLRNVSVPNNGNLTLSNFANCVLKFEQNHGYNSFYAKNKVLKLRLANHPVGLDKNWHFYERKGLSNIRLSIYFCNEDTIVSTHNDCYGIPIIEQGIHYSHLYNEQDLKQICISIISYLKTGRYNAPHFSKSIKTNNS